MRTDDAAPPLRASVPRCVANCSNCFPANPPWGRLICSAVRTSFPKPSTISQSEIAFSAARYNRCRGSSRTLMIVDANRCPKVFHSRRQRRLGLPKASRNFSRESSSDRAESANPACHRTELFELSTKPQRQSIAAWFRVEARKLNSLVRGVNTGRLEECARKTGINRQARQKTRVC